MNEVPEKGRDGRTGASHRPCPCWNSLAGLFRTRSFSPDRQTVFGDTGRLVHSKQVGTVHRNTSSSQFSVGAGEVVASGRSSSSSGSESSSRPQLEISTFALDAECCGALGCRQTDDLLKVRKDGSTRVLCRVHAERWAA